MNIKAKALFYVSIASLVFSIVSLILDCVAYNPLGIAVSAFQIVVSIFGIVGGAILNKPVLVIGIVGKSFNFKNLNLLQIWLSILKAPFS